MIEFEPSDIVVDEQRGELLVASNNEIVALPDGIPHFHTIYYRRLHCGFIFDVYGNDDDASCCDFYAVQVTTICFG